MKKTTAFIFGVALILVSSKLEVVECSATVPKSQITFNKTESTTELPSSTTTSSPSTSTTASTTFAAPITTTPSPAHGPTKGRWMLNSNNRTAIVQMAVEFTIIYHGANNQSVSEKVYIPTNNTNVTGTFTMTDETIKISWNSSNLNENSLALHFKNDTKSYALDNIEVTIVNEEVPNIKPNETLKLVHQVKNFSVPVGKSYRCAKVQTYNLTMDSSSTFAGQMQVSDLQIQAFITDNKNDFGAAQDCEFEISDAVPIAVGCVLAGLVVIVLAVYLISRRRSQARGYVSM